MPELFAGTITDVLGIEVGHAQDTAALTGCTVILCRAGAVAGVDVRGLAPGTRETDLLKPGSLVGRVNAVLLTGGSAFGLGAADGVMRYLSERGVGFDTGIVRVPIVPAAVVFDLGIGDASRWPDAQMGYAACEAASADAPAQGSVGGGIGATVGKVFGMQRCCRGGFGTAALGSAGLVVAAAVVVNAFGDVWDHGESRIIAGARRPDSDAFADTEAILRNGLPSGSRAFMNTVIGVVATNARLDGAQAAAMASAGHDGLARAIAPAHTLYDGDTLFALSTGIVTADRIRVNALAAEVVERAIVNAVRSATAAAGIPAASTLCWHQAP